MKNSIAWSAAAVLLWCADVALAREKAASSAGDQAQAKLQEDFLTWKFGMFIHFNLETFVGREWASGYEDPALFNPWKLDCGQWADAARAAGMKYAVLTTKHTEGYALWDSQYTTHNITAFKNYKHGQGDIVREFVDAFRKRGLKVGFYYCFPGDYSGSGTNSTLLAGQSDLHGLPPEAQGDYVGFMKMQLTELLTQYGPLDLLWVDQYSNPYTGSKWQEIKALVKSLQPNCIVLANNSLDFRDSDIQSYEYPYQKISHPNRALPRDDNQAAAEVCDVLGPSWFWNSGHNEFNLQKAEAVAAMVRLCNARHANYLLDVPPDNTGRIPDFYVKRLKEIGALLKQMPR